MQFKSSHWRHRAKKWVACGLLAAHCVTTTGAIAEGLPDLGDSSDSILSEPQERVIGKRIMMEIRADRSYIDDSELNDYLNGIGNRLVAASRGATNDNRRDFEFFWLNDDAINAFALLGGFIGIHSALMLATTNESELAGVMGHEISHILQRHQARGAEGQKNKAWLPIAGLLAAIVAARSNSSSSGQATEGLLAGSQALAIQSQLDYSRDFEREADRLGIQVMTRAGFDPRGMVSFFERLQRANRHNDGKAPGYLRSHPLTTERIADMQDRVDQLGADGRRNVPDNMDYRLAQARMRVLTVGGNDAVSYFRTVVAERTVLRNRADVYGLALALARTRDYANAEKEVESIRAAGPRHAWIENLAAEIQVGQKNWEKALTLYRAGMKAFPAHRGMLYGYIDTLYESGQNDLALREVTEQLKSIPDDARLYELAAKGYERKNKRLAQHRAIGEAYYRRGNLIGAIEQLEIASKARDGDFYESSSTEARLREWRAEFKNRALLPGEKPDKPDSRPNLMPLAHSH